MQFLLGLGWDLVLRFECFLQPMLWITLIAKRQVTLLLIEKLH